MGHNHFIINRLSDPGKGGFMKIPINYGVFQDRSGAWKGHDELLEILRKKAKGQES